VRLIRWTPEASEQLEAAVKHIRQDNPTAARNVAQAVIDRGDFKIRYEFDVGPDGVAFAKALKRFETTTRWADPDRRHDVCWDRILRNPH
jgi:hypothetical protein